MPKRCPYTKAMTHIILSLTILLCLFATYRGDVEVTNDAGFVPEYPKSISETKTYKEFVKIVEEESLNVTLFLTKTDQYKKGNVKQIISLSVTFPMNKVALKDTDINKELAGNFIKLAASEQLTASGVSAVSKGATTIITNNEANRILPFNYKIYTNLTRGTLGVDPSTEADLAAQETFRFPGPDGKDQTLKVLWVKLNITTIDSRGLKESELSIIRDAIAQASFIYSDSDVPRVVVARLDKELPGNNWQVVDNASEDSFLDAQKYAAIKTAASSFNVFAI